jgi:hypothetical protein
MPALAISPVVRSILSANINLSADEVIRKAKDKGLTAPEASIRTAVHNIRSELKKPKKSKPVAAPAAARQTKPTPAPKPAPVAAKSSTPTPSSSPELSTVLANVALVNKVVEACGGPEPARKVADAVRSCGSVEAFLQHLDLVAGIRGTSA